MKKYLIILILFISTFSYAKNFTISGTIKDAELKKIELVAVIGKQHNSVKSQTITSNGKFSFKMGNNNHPGMYFLKIDNQNNKILRIFFNNEDVELESSFEDLAENLFFIQSVENVTLSNFFRIISKFNNKKSILKDIVKGYVANNNFKNKTKKRLKELISKNKEYLNQFYFENKKLFITSYAKASLDVVPDTNLSRNETLKFLNEHYLDNVDFSNENLIYTNIFPIKISAYFKLKMYTLSKIKIIKEKQIIAIINSLMKRTENINIKTNIATFLLNMFKTSGLEKVYIHIVDKFIDNQLCTSNNKDKFIFRAAQYKKLAVDKTAINIVFDNKYKGLHKDLNNIKSKRILLFFWSTDCPFCKRHLSKLIKLYRQFKPYGFEIVATCIGESRKEFTKKIKELNYNWINYYPEKEWDSKAVLDYYIYATPTMFYIDGNTKQIISKPLSILDLEIQLKEDFINSY